MTTHRQLTHNARSLLLVPVVALVIAGCGSGSSSQLGSVHSASQVISETQKAPTRGNVYPVG
jgi:hypothetical protein